MKQVMIIIPLPLFYNPVEDGHSEEVEEEKFVESQAEVSERFGACRFLAPEGRGDHPGYIGLWVDEGVTYSDPLAFFEVVVEDTAENRQWFLDYAAEVLANRFDQLAICVQFIGPTELVVVERRTVNRK